MRVQLRRAVLILAALTAGLLTPTVAAAPPASASDAPAAVRFAAAADLKEIALGGSLPLRAYVEDRSAGCVSYGIGCDTPTGRVDFTLSGPGGVQTLGSSTLIPVAKEHEEAETSLTQAVVALPAGQYTYTAHYLGDGTFNPNHVSIPVTVTKGSVALTITQNSASTTHGQPVTFTALLGGDSHWPSPAGTITFYDGEQPFGTMAVVPRSSLLPAHAAMTTSALSAGNHLISASYAGDADYGPAQSTTLVHKVSYAILCAPHCVLAAPPTAPTAAPTAPPTASPAAPSSSCASSGSQGHAAGDCGIGVVAPTAAPTATKAAPSSAGDGPSATATSGVGTATAIDQPASAATETTSTGSEAAPSGSGPTRADPGSSGASSGAAAASTVPLAAAGLHSSNDSHTALWLILLIILVLVALALLLWLLTLRRRLQTKPDTAP